jgi:hypothetical protein
VEADADVLGCLLRTPSLEATATVAIDQHRPCIPRCYHFELQDSSFRLAVIENDPALSVFSTLGIFTMSQSLTGSYMRELYQGMRGIRCLSRDGHYLR